MSPELLTSQAATVMLARRTYCQEGLLAAPRAQRQGARRPRLQSHARMPNSRLRQHEISTAVGAANEGPKRWSSGVRVTQENRFPVAALLKGHMTRASRLAWCCFDDGSHRFGCLTAATTTAPFAAGGTSSTAPSSPAFPPSEQPQSPHFSFNDAASQGNWGLPSRALT